MSGQPQDTGPTVTPHYPQHLFASPAGSGLNPNNLKPHACMVNVVQRGNYIHCKNGNHGMRLKPSEILNKDANGNWVIEQMVIRNKKGQSIDPATGNVVKPKS